MRARGGPSHPPRRARSALASLAFAALATASQAGASHAPPWVSSGDAPLPEGVVSARILKGDQPILSSPWEGAPRRGSAARDVHLPIFAARRGPGCNARWLEVGPAAWVCEEAVELSSTPFIDTSYRAVRETEGGLPFRYYFVGPDGSFGYKKLSTADIGAPDMQLEPGFAVAVVEERLVEGARYGRTHNELWVPMRDLGPARPFAFRGQTIEPSSPSLSFAWIVSDKVKVLGAPSSSAPSTDSKARFEVVPVLEDKLVSGTLFARIAEGAWVRASELRRPSLASPPPEVDVEAGEKWIDVELGSQTLVAYEGKRAVFATIVSTGKGREGSATATPRGTFRIWAKLATSNMDNLEDEEAAHYYRMEDVPWVQYFSKGVGLHGAFWHRSFGHVRSHGCVNLAPLDAQRLFAWTTPRVPAGWTAALPSPYDAGTVVRIR
ncbi:L,D-transpeptidase [Polyangium aurulentum]|uniref:L,D-transpeptidase n=1 Tax=Polyangium aurulentum TaxID=2567896 RepID=UPI0010AE5DED|nr:L,D-transpeptidase [Polyangium aurulentum]UQA60991.1 L,D-transpeptidase [Polyangium aurulentum]